MVRQPVALYNTRDAIGFGNVGPRCHDPRQSGPQVLLSVGHTIEMAMTWCRMKLEVL